MLGSGFCFIVGKPTIHNQLHLGWKYLLFHRVEYQTNELCAACQRVFSINLLKYEDILRLVVLSDSGMRHTSSTAFFLHAETQQQFQDREELQILTRLTCV